MPAHIVRRRGNHSLAMNSSISTRDGYWVVLKLVRPRCRLLWLGSGRPLEGLRRSLTRIHNWLARRSRLSLCCSRRPHRMARGRCRWVCLLSHSRCHWWELLLSHGWTGSCHLRELLLSHGRAGGRHGRELLLSHRRTAKLRRLPTRIALWMGRLPRELLWRLWLRLRLLLSRGHLLLHALRRDTLRRDSLRVNTLWRNSLLGNSLLGRSLGKLHESRRRSLSRLRRLGVSFERTEELACSLFCCLRFSLSCRWLGCHLARHSTS